ncbi:MAG: translation elongation factor Ts [Pseudomonadota bacterium]
MAIAASQVKELRERTGAGMMECKKALVEAGGDMEKAVENMRIAGLAKADKKSGRTAAEGKIVVARAADDSAIAMVEVNCETDFVSMGDDFVAFADAVAQTVLSHGADLDALNAAPVDAFGGDALSDVRQAMVAKIGENIQVRRAVLVSAPDGGDLGVYLHGARIGVVAAVSGGTADLAKDIAMHVAASKPVCVDADGVPAETLEKERAILVAEAKESGKPDEIIDKMVEGRMRKYLAEITLVGQPFVKDPDQTVGKLLDAASASVAEFVRFEVGEGIEKKQEDFAAEVMATAKGDA